MNGFKSLEKEIKNTQIVILAGGSGKRMGKVDVPKPLLNLNNEKTLLDNEIEYYARWGFEDFVLLIGYKSDMVLEHLEKRKDFIKDLGISIKVSVDPTTKNWGKGKAIKYAIENGVIDTKKRAIISYPDDLKLDKMLPVKLLVHHLSGKENLSIWMTLVLVSAIEFPYGVAHINSQGIITEFVEKPVMDIYTNIGVSMCEPEVFDIVRDVVDLDADKSIEFEGVVLPILAKKEKIFSMIIPMGTWLPVNDIKSYEKALSIFNGSV